MARDSYNDAWGNFLADAARWVRPEEVADRSELDPRTLLVLLWRHQGLRAMAWFRLASWCQWRGVPAVPGMLQRRLLSKYGLELAAGALVDGGLYVAHPVGCTIQAERIGRNVTIIAAVTVGTRETPRWPRLGDEVFIGTGARVLGDIDLGVGCRVGANAVVITDVPPGATAVGIPARILPAPTG